MHDLDKAEEIAKNLQKDIDSNLSQIVSEEDSKIQIINRVLCECLGWHPSDISAENHHENGFSDYILKNNGYPVLLIEAKRKGIIDIEVAEKNKVRYLKITGSALKTALDGIEQAFKYASPNGFPIAVLTDGINWIIFRTFIAGANYKTKEAIVFPSFQALLNNFSLFFDLLAKPQFAKRIYNALFDEIHQKRLLLSQELLAPISDRDIKISQKSDLAFDLDRVFSSFFSRLTGDEDKDLMIECFVETRESRIADFSLEKMTSTILGNILPNVDDELSKLISSNLDTTEYSATDAGETVFIVGPTGAGKTTFLDRFFHKTLPLAIRKRCVLLRVDCLNATGREDTALEWLTESLIKSIEAEIYPSGNPEWNDLLGLYHGEYKRRAQGVDAQLYANNPERFREKFGEFLDSKVETDREGYLKRLLKDAVHNRKMLPILLIDNSDEFSSEYKQKVFQFTQALRRYTNHCILIFPVTDKSAWSFSKTDIYGIYKSKRFFLPTPSPREVFRKRIDFIKNRIAVEKDNDNKNKNYFLSKNIKLSIKNLDGFAKVLESIFVEHDYTSKTIGELTCPFGKRA